MQKYIAAGVRLAGDPQVRYSAGENAMAVARFSVAANRRIRKQEGVQEADFIPCVCFGKTAEFAEKYLRKGTKINLEGHLTSGSYTNKNGEKVYTLEVTITDMEFAESKAASTGGAVQNSTAGNGSGFMNIPDGLDDEMPFIN